MQLKDVLEDYRGVPLQSLQRTFIENALNLGLDVEVTGHAHKTIVIRHNGERVGYINDATIHHPSIFGIQFPERFGGTGFCPDNLQRAFENEILGKFGRIDWLAKQEFMKGPSLRTYYVVTDQIIAVEYLRNRTMERP